MTDCEVNEWDKWSDCDVQCGYGTMTRSRSIRVQPANGGRDCPELLQKRGCHGQKCEIRTNDKSEKGNIKNYSSLTFIKDIKKFLI